MLKKRILIIVLICILVLTCACGNKTTVSESTADTVTTAVETEKETTTALTKETTEETTVAEVTEPINFIMFGIDNHGYTRVDIDKSDMIMCVSLDPTSKTIKFISLLRDTKAEIEGHYPQKINAAYQFGGAELALQTVNNNFGLEYKDYITLDWSDVAILVDVIGGVDVEISDAEAAQVNDMVYRDVARDGRNAYCTYLNGGNVHLDGTQALHFSRIRKIDSDYYRAGRQHRTLRAIIEKIKTLPITEYPELIKTFIDTVEETSFTVEDLLPWLTMGLDKYSVESYIIPDPDYEPGLWGGVDETGAWVWVYDMKAAGDRLKKILSGEFTSR